MTTVQITIPDAQSWELLSSSDRCRSRGCHGSDVMRNDAERLAESVGQNLVIQRCFKADVTDPKKLNSRIETLDSRDDVLIEVVVSEGSQPAQGRPIPARAAALRSRATTGLAD